uniref:Uncharacterized protein n=1 Tax=Trichogramma kaykai TaxID=54128 RepID=A0ABD2VSP5_9HYME
MEEVLIEFGTALHDNDFGRVLLFLEELGEHPRSSNNSRSRFDIVSLQLRATIGGLDSSHNNNNNNNNDNGSNNFEKRSYGRLQASGSCDSLLIADQQQQQQQEPRAQQQCTRVQPPFRVQYLCIYDF